MFAKYERSDVFLRSLTVRLEDHAVDDGKLYVRKVGRDLLHDRTLRKANSDHQIKVPFCKGTHRRFDRGWIAGLNIVQANAEVLFRTFYPFPRGRVERTVVLTAYIKDDPNAGLT